jgi:hypothetical protein
MRKKPQPAAVIRRASAGFTGAIKEAAGRPDRRSRRGRRCASAGSDAPEGRAPDLLTSNSPCAALRPGQVQTHRP